ncbi:hypothetical protein BHE74_00008969 [Ensete ventricosum]|nr:hypothetical protein BHE74_00008969 [Ensete ventricosum]
MRVDRIPRQVVRDRLSPIAHVDKNAKRVVLERLQVVASKTKYKRWCLESATLSSWSRFSHHFEYSYTLGFRPQTLGGRTDLSSAPSHSNRSPIDFPASEDLEMATPSKKTQASRPHTSEMLKVYENSDPNIPISSPLSSKKSVKSPSIGSAQSKKPTPKTPGRIFAPLPMPLPERARKFIVAKKGSKRAGNGLDFERCRKEAYEALRASQEEFFRRDRFSEVAEVADSAIGEADGSIDGGEKDRTDVTEEALDSGVEDLEGGSEARNMRSLVMEEATNSMPEPGSGRVKHLVEEFESFLSISKVDEADKHEDRKPMVLNWALPGFQPSTKGAAEAGTSSTSIFSSAEVFSSREEKNSRLYSSVESTGDRFSWGRRTSGGGRNKRNVRKCSVLHSFLQQFYSVAERTNFAEQLRLEREMQQKVFLNCKN